MKLLSSKSQLSTFILAVPYTVGVIGIGSGKFPDMILLTPLNLLISLASAPAHRPI